MTDNQIIPISESGELTYTHWDQLTAISKQIMNAGITKLGNPTQINLIILKGKRLGIDIFEALENIIVIQSKTAINGSLASALVLRSGLLADKSHTYEGDGDTRKCSVTVQRKGMSKTTWSFSIREAKIAGLYPGKPGSGWHSYPDTMLYWRALGFAFRREFPDVLQGMYLVEELQDEQPQARIVTTPPAPVDADDPEAAKHPLIAAPTEFGPPAPKDLPKEVPLELVKEEKPFDILAKLRELAKESGVSEEDLITVTNELRLFPSGVEQKLETLPMAKVHTLVKNWNVVLRQVERIGKKSPVEQAVEKNG